MSISKVDAKRMAKRYIARRNVPREDVPKAEELVKNMLLHECYDNPNYKWSLDDFELGTRLGRGKFGRVFAARERQTGLIVALKTMSKREIHNNHVEGQIVREIEIQTHLRHPNILQLLAWFHDDYRIYLVLEYAGNGELYRHLKASRNGHFDEALSAKYIYQVADALNYCHKRHVIHRDIKPENLLLDIADNIKLADFGWSVHAPTSARKTMCGTLDYLPPEIVKGDYYGQMVDNWCIGILCYEFLVGSPPFESAGAEETYAKINSLKCQYPDFMPKGGVDLIKKLLVLDNQKRLTLEEVMKHPWVQANFKPETRAK